MFVHILTVLAWLFLDPCMVRFCIKLKILQWQMKALPLKHGDFGAARFATTLVATAVSVSDGGSDDRELLGGMVRTHRDFRLECPLFR